MSCTARIAPGDVHVWPLSLTAEEPLLNRFAALLDQAEQQRAARFFHERDRHAFILAHGQLRHLLGCYCGVDGAAIRFVATSAGKPRLAPDQGFAAGVSFNLTHSAGRALLALANGTELGVDLESHDRKTDVLSLAQNYFSIPEREAVAGAPESLRVMEFFRIWTAKEAVIKAHGQGLGVALDSFSVAHANGDGDFVRVNTFDTTQIDEGWFVRTLACESGWSAALAGRLPYELRLMGQE